MAFQRTREAPMDFEYEHAPHFSYNVFNTYNNVAHDLAKKAAHSVASGFYVPESRSTRQDPPEVHHVSTKLDDISLDESLPQSTPSPPCPAAPLSPIQDTEQKQSSSSLSSSSLPQTPPDLPVEASSPKNMPLIQAPTSPSSHQHLHQHIYPSAPSTQEEHRDSWIILATGMLHVGCQIALFTLAVFVVVQFAVALRRDVSQRMAIYESDILEDHYHCRMEYAKNRCDPSTRLPAMDEQCRRWQQCLYRPMWVGKTRVLSETLGDIVNGFFDTISFKTMMFVFGITFALLWTRSTAAAAASRSSTALETSNKKEIGWNAQ
ncbi:hypothetical protein LRAMOSA10754 [Lichtheimia ramosa]|uniref:Brl1/Brr6 domain-containing protein n=1 Tax=Lichtheimia ramosa TaxID=688394 RepID=A0A077WQG6_9FUNG|nr:hypothetical protein LRAMOSA10754 [Lichtheimia ramosa]